MYNLEQLLNPDIKVPEDMGRLLDQHVCRIKDYERSNPKDSLAEVEDKHNAGKRFIIEGLSESEKTEVQKHLLKTATNSLESQESAYRKIIKHLLSIKPIGCTDSNNMYAIYSQNGFITNVEAKDSNEALDKAVDELVKAIQYA